MPNNSKSFKPIYSNLDDVKKGLVRISLEETKEGISTALRDLRNDMAACGWIFPSVTLHIATLINSMPPDAIQEEGQALFVVERLLTPRPDLAAFWHSSPVLSTNQKRRKQHVCSQYEQHEPCCHP